MGEEEDAPPSRLSGFGPECFASARAASFDVIVDVIVDIDGDGDVNGDIPR